MQFSEKGKLVLYPNNVQIHLIIGIYGMLYISGGLLLCRTTFTANQNARYISLYIHA